MLTRLVATLEALRELGQAGLDPGLHRFWRRESHQLRQFLDQALQSHVEAASDCAEFQQRVYRHLDTFFRQFQSDGLRLDGSIDRYYTAWPTRGGLLHKDLGGALHRELDRYVQEQILPLDPFQQAVAPRLTEQLEQARLVRQLAGQVIDWLARPQRLAREIWLRRRLVRQTSYGVTLDRVPEELYPEICANGQQRAAWRHLFALDELLPAADQGEDATGCGGHCPLTLELLRAHPYLVLDTAYFSGAFTDRLLASIDNVDETLDGVLIHGENFQALRLLGRRYAETVRCIYLDPPYNTGSAAWAYADRLDHTQWAALMRDRLVQARDMLRSDGAIFITLDDNEQARLRLMLEELFGEENFLATIIWEKVHTRKNSARHFSVSHDYIPAFAKDKSQWHRELLPREHTAAYANPDDDPRGPWKTDPVYANKPYSAVYQITKPNGVVLDPPPGLYWRFSEQNFLAKAARDEVLWGHGNSYPMVKRYLAEVQAGLVPVTLFTRSFAGDNALANAELRALFGAGRPVSYPKPSRLIGRICQIATRREGAEVVLDFFAGSGTTGQAVIDQNRRDGGRRKFVLVEVGPYFDTVLKPRIEKTIYSAGWRRGRPTSRQGSSAMFKVLRLESYDEALAAGPERPVAPAMFDHPFQASSRQQVDLPETFNYLLGMSVERIESDDNVRTILGTTADGRRLLVVWRDLTAVGDAAIAAWLKAWAGRNGDDSFDAVYINGATSPNGPGELLPGWNLMPIEPEFQRLLSDETPAD